MRIPKTMTLLLSLTLSAPFLTLASAEDKPAKDTASQGTGDVKTGPLEYTEVIAVDGASAAELFTRAQVWFAGAFNDSNKVLKVQDKDAGVLVGQGLFTYTPSFLAGSATVKGHVTFQLQVSVKDGRYRYQLTKLVHKPDGIEAAPQSMGTLTGDKEPSVPNPLEGKLGGKKRQEWRVRVWNDMHQQVNKQSQELLADLQNSMKSVASPSNDDSW